MATAYNASMMNRVMPKIQQWQATTGRRITPQMFEALMSAELGTESARALELDKLARSEALQKRSLDLQETQGNRAYGLQQQQLADAKSAAKVSGIVGGVTNLATLGLVGKSLLPKAVPAVVAPSTAIDMTVPALTPPGPLTMPGTPPPAIGAQGSLTSTAPATGAQTALTPAAPALPSGGLTDAQMAYDLGGTPGMGAQTATGGAVAPGVLATAGYTAGAVGAGVAAYQAGKIAAPYLEQVGVPADTTEAFSTTGGLGVVSSTAGDVVSSVTGSDTAGSIISAIINPVQFGIGQIADATGTVLCTELNRQGELSDRDVKWARIFRMRHVSQEVYEGYLAWGVPIVGLMQRSRTFNFLFKPIAKAIIRGWIKMGKTGEYNAMCHVTEAFCLLVYRLKVRQLAEAR